MSYFEQTKVTDSTGTLINPVQDENIILLRKITKLLEASATADTKQRQKISIDALGNTGGTPTEVGATVPVSGSVTATAAASSVNMGNVTIQFGAQATAATAGVDSRFFMIDTARNAYANGIRPNLTW